MIAVLGALAAISGNGGLTNTALSGYARDQGWGMGKHVGAIPSVIGGQKLDAVARRHGVSDQRTNRSARFRRWYRFLLRDQLVVWMPACFVGVALPSMLSRAVSAARHAGQRLGRRRHDGRRTCATPSARSSAQYFWLMTLFCGFLVLAPAAVTHVRRRPPPLGRSVLDGRAVRPPLGSAPHSLALFRRRLRLRRVRPDRAHALEPQAAAGVGRRTSTTPRSASVASTCWP